MSSVSDPNHWRRQFLLFATAIGFLALGGGIFESTFNNFLNDVFHMSAETRGKLEFPRELPGFMVAIFAGLLFFLSETKTAAIAALVTAAGITGLVLCGGNYQIMFVSMIIWSAGAHLGMPMQSSISLALAEGKSAGSLMGRIGSYANIAMIGGAGIVWLGMGYLHFEYATVFAIGAGSAVCAAFVFSRIKIHKPHSRKRSKLLFRRRYGLYYILCVLYGARKQLFLTFGPLVLIKIFNQPPTTIAKLMIISAVLGIIFRPALGWLIDHLSERAILMADAVLLVLVCLGYGFGGRWLPMPYGMYLVFACYVLDVLLIAVDMARSIYLDKIALSREDVAPTLTLGVTIDHAVSMSIPTAFGLIWGIDKDYGYSWVFVGAAGLAMLGFVAASFIRVPNKAANLVQAEAALAEELV